ncbi:MAG TPA: GxGYxYP domain-containing protein [Phycisphaerae bacterium]|nr:GxGYxYP domain-containing protein [Phycisphaerae bacterium]
MITRRTLLENGLVTAGAALTCSRIFQGLSRAEALASPEGSPLVPRSNPPARHLVVASVGHLPVEQQTALCVMQGLVNRTQPRLFLVFDTEDAHWLHWLRERGDIETTEWLGAYDALSRFRDQVKGCIVTDPAVPATTNVGTLLAGLTDSIVVSPELLDVFRLPIREDLRGRGRSDIDIYRWAYNQFFASAHPSVLAHLNPFSSRLRDYMAQFRVFTFWLSGRDDAQGKEEIEFARELFARVGPNVPVLGWWGAHGQGPQPGIREKNGAELASEYGLLTVCMAWDGYCEGTSNLSVHSGTKATFCQKPAPPRPQLEDKVYYAFLRTDGDGTNFWRQEFLKRWWDPQRGSIPMCWPIGPLTSDFIPDIMDYYYRTASADDCFMAAVSGLGYIHEELYGAKLSSEARKAGFDRFLQLTSEYMRRMDLHAIHTYQTSSDELIRRYAHARGVDALFLGYNRIDGTTADNVVDLIDGVPIFRTVLKAAEFRFKPWDEQVRGAADQVRRHTPSRRPAFLAVTLANWTFQEETQMETLGLIEELQRLLGPGYEAVRADHLIQLYKQFAAHR